MLSSDFTPLPSLIGGALIGLSASLLLVANGRVAGITGVINGLLLPRRGDIAWRALFVAGLAVGGLLMAWLAPGDFRMTLPVTTPTLLVAGLLVGFGTRMANGCTSGHGVCGISRLSPRSLLATACFMATGFAAVFAIEHVLRRAS